MEGDLRVDVCNALSEIDYLISSISLENALGMDQKDLLILQHKVFSLRASFLGLLDIPKLRIIAVYLLDQVKQALLCAPLKPAKAVKSASSFSFSCFGRPALLTPNKRLMREAFLTLDEVALALQSETQRPIEEQVDLPSRHRWTLFGRIGATHDRQPDVLLRRRGHIPRMLSSTIFRTSQRNLMSAKSPEHKWELERVDSFDASFASHESTRKQMESTMPPEKQVQTIPSFFPELNSFHPVLRFVDTTSPGHRLVGIVGQGGVGKTTLLVHILQMLRSRQSFSFVTYVELVGDRPDKQALLCAQASVLLQLGGLVGKFKNLHDGRLALRERFQDLAATSQSFCIAIDNVWTGQSLKDLLPDIMSIPSSTLQSCCIITSRMHSIVHALEEVCRMRVSVRLFHAMTFEQKPMPPSAAKQLLLDQFNHTRVDAFTNENVWRMVDEFCVLCGGLPLALKAVGSLLAQTKLDHGEDLRRMMDSTLVDKKHSIIRGILETTYNKLKSSSQEALCDIAAFLHGWRWDIVQSIVGVEEMNELLDFHLIQCADQKPVSSETPHDCQANSIVSGNIVVMHDLTRNLALEKIREQLWDPADLPTFLLWDERFVNAVRYLHLDEEDFKLQGDVPILPLGGRCFSLMWRLCVLDLSGTFKCSELLFPDSLLCIKLANNNLLEHLSDVPSNLQHFELELCMGLLDLPLSIYGCANLQSISICGCPNLSGFNSLSNWKSLKKLHLESCFGITQLPTDLEALELLILHGCVNLHEVPPLPGKKIIMNKQEYPNLSTTSQVVLIKNASPIKITSPLQLKEVEPESTLSDLEKMPFHRCEKIEKLSPAFDQLRLQHCTCSTLGGLGLEAVKLLRKLKLEFCQNLIKLPDSICQLESLVVLDLHGCSQVEQLPVDFGNLKSLENLHLRDCQKLKSLPSSTAYLKELKELDLSGCIELEGLPEEMGSLSSLRVVRLAKCEKLTFLPSSICSLDSLSQLDLHGCEQLKELPDKIGNLTSLETLFLTECHTIRVLPDSICKLNSVVGLYMNGCSHLTELPEEFGSLSNLQVLNLAECTSLRRVCNSIGNLESLVTLDLQWCLKLEELPQEFGINLKSLKFLFLMECQVLQSLPKSLSRLETLQKLDVSGCLKLQELPRDIGRLSSLRALRLANCEALKKLPDSICQLQLLRVLNMHGCYMVEELPTELDRLSALETLNLGKCRLLQLLPLHLQGLPSLRELDMRGSLVETALEENGQLYFVGSDKVQSYLAVWSESIHQNTTNDVAPHNGIVSKGDSSELYTKSCNGNVTD